MVTVRLPVVRVRCCKTSSASILVGKALSSVVRVQCRRTSPRCTSVVKARHACLVLPVRLRYIRSPRVVSGSGASGVVVCSSVVRVLYCETIPLLAILQWLPFVC